MDYHCHQCFAKISLDDIAHLDLYSDLCWIQCTVCEAAFGPACGMDRTHNPHPHGYLNCPSRIGRVQRALSSAARNGARRSCY